MHRLATVAKHVRGRNDDDDDVVVCCAVRTPLTRAKKGGLKDCFPEDLLRPLMVEVVARTGVSPSAIEDVCIGNVLQSGAGALSSRVGQLLGGLPASVPLAVVNRQCSSGLQAIANVAGSISSGFISVGLAGGVESMTHFDMMETLNPQKLSPATFEHEEARNCLLPMGLTSEILSERFGVTRESMDAFSVASHTKAAAARQLGRFKEEIVPVPLSRTKQEEEEGATAAATQFVTEDDGIRPATNLKSLAKLKPSFKDGGRTTAGNSSQMSDGASLTLLARRSAARRLGLPILAALRSFAVVGVPPDIMGIGPAKAIPQALEQAGLSVDDISIFELNEAFASQAVWCVQELQLPLEKVNPKGGAIALGHPLGCTGSRQLASLLPELRRTAGRYGVVSMCIGTGMGAAAVFENLQL
eukprot:GHVT01088326.1.p1 GENE.GHVT01088326.1~~GHVT01088326.1.p1  ORF type:complete len:415 (-),score=108.79 GHVT01088326.1:853-2097(-)